MIFVIYISMVYDFYIHIDDMYDMNIYIHSLSSVPLENSD